MSDAAFRLPLVLLGDDRLRNRPRRFERFEDADAVRHLTANVKRMFKVLDELQGVGLAATQVACDVRVAVIADPRIVCVNLEVVDLWGTQHPSEACLSTPLFAPSRRRRAQWTRVRYQDLKGEQHELEVEDLLAQIFQHEADHLDGRIWTDPDHRDWTEAMPA